MPVSTEYGSVAVVLCFEWNSIEASIHDEGAAKQAGITMGIHALLSESLTEIELYYLTPTVCRRALGGPRSLCCNAGICIICCYISAQGLPHEDCQGIASCYSLDCPSLL